MQYDLPGDLPAVATQALSNVVVKLSSGKVDEVIVVKIAVECRLDVLVEVIECPGPADGLLEMVELILANHVPHSFLETLVQRERTYHSSFPRNKL
jgi:hypothetical protein